MKKTINNLNVLNAMFCTLLILANILASKVVQLGIFTIPAAVVAYPFTFLITDIIGELWGKKEANNTVKNGLICQIFALILTFCAVKLPVASFANNQNEFVAILGGSLRVTFASLVGYFCSQTWDVWVFHKIRNKYIQKHGSTAGGRWIWNNGSTMTSQIIDTAIFITIAFYGVVPNIWNMIFSQYVIKFIFAICDTPIFYLLTGKAKTKKEIEFEKNVLTI